MHNVFQGFEFFPCLSFAVYCY